MQVQIGGIDDCDLVNGGSRNVAHTIFFAGCNRGCPGCHNPILQPMDSGYSTTVDKVNKGINANDLATCVVITGGEPLLQQSAVFFIAMNAWSHSKKVWLYTSYEFSEIPDHILQYCDVVKTGWYDESKRVHDSVLATSNQKYHYKGDDGVWTSN